MTSPTDGGLVIFVDGAEHPGYVRRADVERVDTDSALAMYHHSPGDSRRITGPTPTTRYA